MRRSESTAPLHQLVDDELIEARRQNGEPQLATLQIAFEGLSIFFPERASKEGASASPHSPGTKKYFLFLGRSIAEGDAQASLRHARSNSSRSGAAMNSNSPRAAASPKK